MVYSSVLVLGGELWISAVVFLYFLVLAAALYIRQSRVPIKDYLFL